MKLNATLLNLFTICPRECWLHAQGITMEHTSELVYDGKLLHETSYPQRTERYTEVELKAEFAGNELAGKIDFFDKKEKIIHETKRGNKVEAAHEMQVKFYIWLFALNGMQGVSGKIEYPRLRQTTDVSLSDEDEKYLQSIIPKIERTLQSETCPPLLHAKVCKSCSYFEFCYSSEL